MKYKKRSAARSVTKPRATSLGPDQSDGPSNASDDA